MRIESLKRKQRPQDIAGAAILMTILSASAGCGQTASDNELSDRGTPIIVRTTDVEPFPNNGFAGSPNELSIFVPIPANIIRLAFKRIPKITNGFALYAFAGQRSWEITQLQGMPMHVMAKTVGVAASWDYRSFTGAVAIASNIHATRARLDLLDRYPCRDLGVRIYVSSEGTAYFSNFIAPSIRSAGPACLPMSTFETRGFHAEP